MTELNKPIVSQVLSAFVNYFESTGDWGNLRLAFVLGDIDVATVTECANEALKDEDTFGYALALMLLQMTENQRRGVARRATELVLAGEKEPPPIAGTQGGTSNGRSRDDDAECDEESNGLRRGLRAF